MAVSIGSRGQEGHVQSSYCCREMYQLNSPKGHHSPVIQTEGDKSLATQGQDTLCWGGKESSSQMGMAEISASVCSVHDRGLWDFSWSTA